MKKTLIVAAALTVVAGAAHASGWRIPEQSVNSAARAGGYVAYTPSADASYYNPANMSWLEDRAYLEADATWIHLTSIDYTDDSGVPFFNGSSKNENFLMPTFFAVSPYYGNFRFGLAVTAPGGLSKRWQDPYPRTFAEEFSLKIFEANPTVSYKFCDQFSASFGLRGVYIDGKVKSSGVVSPPFSVTRDMEGDALEAGFNIGLSARPIENLNLAITYRSNVDLGVSGTANLNTNLNFPPGSGSYSGDVDVTIPLPAVLAVAASYTFFDQLTVELEYDCTYWSEYEYLDFNYSTTLTNPLLFAVFDKKASRDWSDTDSFRLSMEYDFKNNFVLMAGFAIDENPAPEGHVNFELPDSDALLYSVGFRYKLNPDMEIGVAYLYDYKKSRHVNNNLNIAGTFENASAHLFTVGFSWKL